MDHALKVPCSLVTQGKTHLLIPNSAIVEVVKTSVLLSDDGREFVHWSNRDLPVYDERRRAHTGDNTTITVIVRTPEDNQLFAIPASQFPRSIQANMHNVTEDTRPPNTHAIAIAYILVDGQHAIIPNLDLCKKKIS
ncbi:MAG: hypothetical protein OEZ43_00180 [Gammaproteobacteria bacterium]|nr:hypothetical protein [Gammaproteobacteria bacterium]